MHWIGLSKRPARIERRKGFENYRVPVISSAESNAKARELTLKVRSQYVPLFKEPTGDPDIDILLEDLPPKGSAQKAKRFLEDNSDLRDAENVVSAAVALSDQKGFRRGRIGGLGTQLPHSTSSVIIIDWSATGTKRWNPWGGSFRSSICCRHRLWFSRRKPLPHFHFGLVYMARFRQLGTLMMGKLREYSLKIV
jgi:hypothetical protein